MATIRGVKLPEGVHLDEVLFEFQTIGRSARVVAVDPASNTEVVMVGDPSYGEETLKRLAIRKLAFVIAKKQKAARGEN